MCFFLIDIQTNVLYNKFGDTMKIEKIEKLNNGKYKIYLDNKERIVTYDEVILENKLLYNKDINYDLLNKLNIETSYYNIYSKVIKYITVKIRSEFEINKYLDKLKVNEEEKNKIIFSLKKIGLINDINFLRSFIADKMNLSNDGPNKIRYELSNHNIPEELIDQEIEKYNNKEIYDKLKRLVLKKINLDHKHSNYVLKQKILVDFVNYGYDKNMIQEVLETSNIDSRMIIEKEYNILLNKLSKKYFGSELDYQIKQKLYAKGFSLDEINKIKSGI